MKAPGLWIRTRARRIAHVYKVPRRLALVEARLDWVVFMGAQRLQLIKAGGV
jgi:hypothetical protein